MKITRISNVTLDLSRDDIQAISDWSDYLKLKLDPDHLTDENRILGAICNFLDSIIDR